MRTLPIPAACFILFCFLFTATGCLNAKHMDKYVADQYNNELPKPNKKNKAEITVMSASPDTVQAISTSVSKTDNFLPLVIYWKYKHRITCTLNPGIPLTGFTNAVNAMASRGLTKKLNGDKLELTVTQIPSAFSMVMNEQMVVPVYPIAWTKVYVEPDYKDLVVSYKVTGASTTAKTGTLTVKNPAQKNGFNFLQSWKSATSEYLSNYDAMMNEMSKSLVEELVREL